MQATRSHPVQPLGPPPPVVERLLALSELRFLAHRWHVRSIRLERPYAVLAYASRRLIRELVDQSKGQLRVADEESAYLPLGQEVTEPDRILARLKSLLRSA